MTTTTSPLSYRDRAILKAVAAGRCTISTRDGGTLVIDGMGCADQFVGPRLRQAGLIAATAERACLTPSGQAVLEAA